jgi:hypothetical protein
MLKFNVSVNDSTVIPMTECGMYSPGDDVVPKLSMNSPCCVNANDILMGHGLTESCECNILMGHGLTESCECNILLGHGLTESC